MGRYAIHASTNQWLGSPIVTNTAEIYWSRFPDLLTTDEVGAILTLRPTSVIAALKNDRLGGYLVARRWLVAKADLKGFLAIDTRARKTDAALLVEKNPAVADDIALFAQNLPRRLTKSRVAQLLRTVPKSLTTMTATGGALRASEEGTNARGLNIGEDGRIAREDLVEFLRLCANLGPRFI
mgnify:CR=1 FL=1